MSDTPLPYEAVLNAPATAVLALIAVVVVVALVLVLRALLSRRLPDAPPPSPPQPPAPEATPGCRAEHVRIWAEIDLQRKRSHELANQLHEYHLEVVKVKRRMGDAEE